MDARAALLEAVARGRPVPKVQVRQAAAPASSLPGALQARGLEVENLQYQSDDSPQGWVPLRLAKHAGQPAGQQHEQLAVGQQQQGQQGQGHRLPVVILLHATGGSRDSLAEQQAALAARGYLAAAIDCRYHGDRAVAAATSAGAPGAAAAAEATAAAATAAAAAAAEGGRGGDGHTPLPPAREVYQQALVAAWRGSGERPFLLDTVWDVQRLLDYLCSRPDVDAGRIGCTGVSLGGMHTWLAAAADERIAVAAPVIGVQWFGWAVEHRQYQGRVDSIPLVFEAAAKDLGSSSITAEVVTAVWNKLLPGLLERYDAPYSLPLIAPRPMLVANGELDPRCPMEGVQLALDRARQAYAEADAADCLALFVDPGVGHSCTPAMWEQAELWFDRHLSPGN